MRATPVPRLWQSLWLPDVRPFVLAVRPALASLVVVSCLVNLLTLAGPLFMLQVYDRVLPSRSLQTLVGLLLLVFVATCFGGVLDLARSRVLARLGCLLEEHLSARIFTLVVDGNLRADQPASGLQIVRDLDAVRGFLSSPALTAFCDLPWTLLYLGLCFLFHPLMGAAVLASAVLLCALMLATEALLRRPTQSAATTTGARHAFVDVVRRNASFIHALGMREAIAARWNTQAEATLGAQQASTDIAAALGSLLRSVRAFLQSALLAIGAWLVVEGEATAGVMLAATILTGRALAPVELLIAQWRVVIRARESWTRIVQTLDVALPTPNRLPLPAVASKLQVTSLGLTVPGREAPVAFDVSFELQAGSALAIVGPSGSGKSSLAKALVGLWQPARGVIRVDGARLDHYQPDVIGRQIGYLPQDIELLPGTIADNIARCRNDAPERLLAAAQAAGVHELVLRLPNGYETAVGEGGAQLSGGQRQRIALARALYGDPFLVVLDEPNSNLDAEGEAALARAIEGVRRRGGITIVVAHRANMLSVVDKVLVMNEGRPQAFGTRDQIFPQFAQPVATKIPSAPRPARSRAKGRTPHAVAAE
jgi:ATP-binding cassette, subfamily C, bacterial PrsD